MTVAEFTKRICQSLVAISLTLHMVPCAEAQNLTAEQLQAVSLWNQARAEVLNGSYADAEKKLRQADHLYPHMSRIQDLWGLSLVKIGKVEPGLQQLLLATSDPNVSPNAWINLGLAYEAKGDLNKAIEANKKYLAVAPQGPEATRMRAYVAALSSGVKTLGGDSTADYLAQATSPYNMHWQSDKMPIKIYIAPGDGVPGYRPAFERIVKAAMIDWIKASNNSIGCAYQNSPTGADINIRFSNDPAQLSNRAEAGEAKYVGRAPALMHVDVVLLTTVANPEDKVTDNAFSWLAHHELGHALGLVGHSPNTSDVMCFLESQLDRPAQLTERDAKTIQLLYNPK
ncbi:MAG: matrixin family metalloprotease [Candidatus Obscuribacterales bacterium]|nr:matrixin family metalloprotease [Candidatus Obscuribacterales bacterium]